jgi:hypothetical protein
MVDGHAKLQRASTMPFRETLEQMEVHIFILSAFPSGTE